MSVFNFFKPVHGNQYLGNTDATQVYFSLQVYETVYMKASLDLKVENAEVGWKILRNFSVWDRERRQRLCLLLFCHQIRLEVLRSCAGSKWNQTQKVQMPVQWHGPNGRLLSQTQVRREHYRDENIKAKFLKFQPPCVSFPLPTVANGWKAE